jgi:Fe-S oxidoreductase
MSALGMGLVLVGLWGLFGWSAHRRWALLLVGSPTWESRSDKVVERLRAVVVFALFQKKMRYYFWAGIAHNLIFAGFGVLLLRTLILWGRGFDPGFNLWILGPETVLGPLYSFAKDVFATLVLIGVSVFVYYRVIKPQKRMALSVEGLVILGIIAVMMLSDMLYDGAATVINVSYQSFCGQSGGSSECVAARTIIAPLGQARQSVAWHPFPEPCGSLLSVLLSEAPLSRLIFLSHLGFWTHSTLVLVFLNILPYSKHFHIITAIPNVFLGEQTPPGRLRPMAKSTEALLAEVEAATEDEEGMASARIGYSRVEHFTWKDILDFYTCTECGRCTDNCPAALTGKKLSPKHLTLALRDELYTHQDEVASRARSEGSAEVRGKLETKALVPDVVDPDVLWACTTCRACEEQCPVNITYVDKIVQMRRNLVTIQGEFPAALTKPFEGMETNGNPWNLSRLDRAKWTEGLEIPLAAENPKAEVLYWVGCAASYDDRAKKIARATALLLKEAKVDFAILGEEETCSGDPARRAGNEYLYSMLAETNVETLLGYRAQGGVKTIITTCPHCFNTLKNEYPDFGATFEVVHHTDYLLGLLAEGKLSPKKKVKAKVAYHDSCYLGRYNGIYDSPRQILQQIEGVELLEVENASRSKGLCCGAGGAQMFMEEMGSERVNVKRTKQLLETGAETVASACPFCMTMLTDGLKAESKDEEVRVLDVVELLFEAAMPDSAAE